MRNNNHHFVDMPGTLRGLAVVCVALMPLFGCKSTGTVEWQEDRGIPFSPDDRAIAYRHHDGVYVARTRGDKHRRIYESRPGWSLSSPHWAPGQRAVLFAVTDGSREAESGLLNYSLYFWPAPEEIWTSEVEQSNGDSASLPTNWSPANPQWLASARCRAEIQVKADALFEWHPDGKRVLFLDTDHSGLQTVFSVDLDTSTRTVASPIRAASHAFSISPSGEYLVSATRGPDADALWLGPIGADKTRWKVIESNPAPPIVPTHEMDDAGVWERSAILHDLRPRLGIWSPDSQWLAHLRAPSGSQSQKWNPNRQLVLTPVATDRSQRILAMPKGQTADLHWAPDEHRLGLLSNTRLLLVDPESSTITELSGTLRVEHFLGWSEPGTHLAYLSPAEDFHPETVLVPIGRVRWAPAARHNLMVAGPTGILPRSRFGLMNISFARWSNQSAKISFWATHLPTVSNLPPGDPAAVLDLDENAIRWYPTDVTEFSQVGHYYLLNRQYADAIKFYTDALAQVSDSDEDRVLAARIHLWRGVSRLASGEVVAARDDLRYFREHVIPPGFGIPASWDGAVFRALSTDRIFLSTLLDMGQIKLAVDESIRIVEQDDDARRVQGLCYLALIDKAIGQHTLFTDSVVTRLVPAAMQSKQIPRELADGLVTSYLEAALHPDNQRFLTDRTKRRLAGKLVELSEGMRESHPEEAVRLYQSAAVFYRESGDTALEIGLLKSTAQM